MRLKYLLIGFLVVVGLVYLVSASDNIIMVSPSTYGSNVDSGVSISLGNETRVDSNFTHPLGNPERVYVNESGWYKVSYACQVRQTGTSSRALIQSYVRVNGVAEVTPSRGYGYCRQTGNDGDRCNVDGVLLSNLTDGDYIELVVTKLRGAGSGHLTEGSCWLYAQKVDNKVVQVYDGAGGQSVTSAGAVLNLDSVSYEDSDFFTANAASDSITISNDGWYKVYYSTSSEKLFGGSGANDRMNPRTIVRVNGNGIGPGGAYSFIRESSNADTGVEESAFLWNFSAGDQIELFKDLKEDGGDVSKPTTQADESWLLIEHINTSDVLMIYDSAGGQSSASGVTNQVTFDTNYLVGGNYTHAASASEIYVNKTGWFEMSYTLGWDDNDNGARHTVCAWITRNGVEMEYSRQCHYSRGITGGRFNSVSANFVLNNTDGDVYELNMYRFGGTAGIEPDATWVSIIPLDRDLIVVGGGDSVAPNVTGVLPSIGSSFNISDVVEISANVSDNVNVSAVVADITLPNGTIERIVLSNVSDKYNASYVVDLVGRHVVRIIANDTSNNLNDSETTYFDVDGNFSFINGVGFGYLGGTRENVYFYNGSLRINSGAQGNFSSQIFDAGEVVSWKNISWVSELCYGCGLPDNQQIEAGDFVRLSNMTGNVLLMHMNEASGTTSFVDDSGNGNNGDCSAFPAGCPTAGVAGKFDTALNFDGTNDRVRISDDASLDITGDIAIELWTNANNYVGDPDIVTKGTFNQAYSVWYVQGTKKVVFSLNNNQLTSNSGLTIGNWHHVVVTREGSTRRIYIDGVEDVSDTFGAAIGTTNTKLKISTSTFSFNGVMDEVAIYNRSLSASEIGEHYKRGALRLNLSVRSCDDVLCVGESWIDINDTSLQNLSLGDNQYFQYDFGFSTENITYSPLLYNVSVNYDTVGVVDSTNPNISIVYPLNQSYGVVQTGLNYTAGDDVALNSCWYSLNGGVANVSINCGVNVSGLDSGEGSSTWKIYVNDSSGNENSSSVTFFVDSLNPSISGLSESPSDPTTYSQGQRYDFNSSISDTNLDSVLIEFDGVNYSTSASGAIYNFSILDLGVGTYNYYWFANDSLGNLNISSVQSYTVSQASGDVATFVDGSRAEVNVEVGYSVWFNGSLVDGQFGSLNLTQNGVELNYSESNDVNYNQVFGSLGNFVINTSYSGNLNYTAGSESWTVTVSDTMSPYFTSIPTDSVLIYGDGFGVDFDATDGFVFDSFSINWTDAFTINASGFLENTTELGVGNYLINVTINDSSNNLNSTTYSVTVNVAVGNVSLLINGTEGNQTDVFGVNTNASASTLFGSVLLYWDGVDATSENAEDVLLGVGIYNYTVFSSGDQNHSGADLTRWVQITQSFSEVNLTLNGTEGNISIYQGDSIDLNGSLITGEGIIELYNNGSLINLGSGAIGNLTTFNSIGVFNITVVYVDSQNYSGSFETYFVNVSEVPDIINPLVNLVEPLNLSYGIIQTELNYTASDSNLDSCWYSLDGGANNVSIVCGMNVTGLDSGQGSSTWTIYANDSLGNVNSSSVSFSVDSLEPGVLIISPNNINYNNATILVNISSDGDSVWFFNGSDNETYSGEIYRTFSEGNNGLVAYANDSLGNENQTSVTFFVDSVNPEISFGVGTENNGSVFSRDWIYVNVSVNESNEEVIGFRLYNSSGLVNASLFSSGERAINWTGLLDGVYYYNVSVNDSLGNSNFTETRVIDLNNEAPSLVIESPSNVIYGNSSILINLSSNGESIWFEYNGANESYGGEVYRSFSDGGGTLRAYANSSSGILVSESVTFFVNTLQLTCEAGGPYQQGALVLMQGGLSNETSVLSGSSANLSILSGGAVNYSELLITANDGGYESQIANLSVGDYVLNVSVNIGGINQSCTDSFELGGAASFVVDKIASIWNVSTSEIIYNISLRVTNNGGSNILDGNVSDFDGGLFDLGNVDAGESVEKSYLLNSTRANVTSYYLSDIATALGVDSFSGNLISANSSSINLTIPPISIGKLAVITKNVRFENEESLNVTYKVSSTLFNAGDEDLVDMGYVDTDISGTAIFVNLSKGGNIEFSNLVTIDKAASNVEHEFELGTATSGVDIFYSNRPKVNIPGYGGPADAIVYAPVSVNVGESLNAIIEVKNVNPDIGQDFVVDYWITNEAEDLNYTSGQQTVFVSASGSTNVSVSLSVPFAMGDYRLRVLVTWIGGSATSFDSFGVVSSVEGGGGGGGGGGGSSGVEPEEKVIEKERIIEKETIIEKDRCEEPYIQSGGGCCLDENENSICDGGEIGEQEESERPDGGRGITGLFIQGGERGFRFTLFGQAIIFLILFLISYFVIEYIRRTRREKINGKILKGVREIKHHRKKKNKFKRNDRKMVGTWWIEKVFGRDGMKRVGKTIRPKLHKKKVAKIYGKNNKKKKNSLVGLVGKSVASISGIELGVVEDVILENYKIRGLKVRLIKKRFNLKGALLGYRHVRDINDIVVVDEKVIGWLDGR